MDGASAGFLRIIIFLIAYVSFLVFAYRMDPRFSLKYEKPPSFKYLIWISTVGTAILLLIMLGLNYMFSQDLIAAFGLDRPLSIQREVPLGLIIGAVIFLLYIPIDMLISSARSKFFPNYKSRREEEIKKLIFSSLPESPRLMFAVLMTVSIKAAIFEELIFRGYLLNNLLLLTSPALAITVQAILFFIPHLYQGVFNALLTLIGGFIFGLIFFLTSSLLVVMITHFTGDMIGLVVQVAMTGESK